MNRKIVKSLVIGYAVLLALVAIMPIANAESIENEGRINAENEGKIDGERLSFDLPGDTPQPLWKQPQHKSIAEIAAEKVGWIDRKYIDILNWSSYEPDSMDPTFATETWDWDNSQQCKHAYFVNPIDRAIANSRADELCQYYYDLAMDEFTNGNIDEAFEHLGYATHYLQDVGNPYVAIEGLEFRGKII